MENRSARASILGFIFRICSGAP